MKILHVIESDGGTVEFIFLLAKYSPKVEHKVFSGQRAWAALHKIKELDPDGFPSNVQMDLWGNVKREIQLLGDTKALLNLINWLKKQTNFDAVHLHSSKAGFLGRIACRYLGERRIVYTTQAVSFIRHDISSIKRTFFVLLERIGHLLGGTVVCCSTSEKEAMTKKGIPAIVIPNGTESPALGLDRDGSHPKIRIVSVGRATTQKDPLLFSQIAKEFLSNQAVEFVWVGDGELREELKVENIQMTGWLSRDRVREELRKADIYLSTASWEGMPFAVLEAMSLGLPLLLTGCIGNIDLVERNENGFIFKNVEEGVQLLKKLVQNQSEIKKMGKRSKSIFETKYEFSKIAPQFLSLYQSFQKREHFFTKSATLP